MKKIILPIFFLLFSSVSQADTLNISTVLKPPINTFNRLQLVPKTYSTPSTCERGTVFLDQATREVMVCTGGITFATIHSPWTQTLNLIYLRDWKDQNVKVGVGTTTPKTKFEVSNDTLTPLVYNSFQVATKDTQENLGINIITRGVPNAVTGHWAAFLYFRISNILPTPATDGRILYAKRRTALGVPWGRSGLGIAADAIPDLTNSANIYDIWMDADNGNVGIGLGAVPATRVQDFAQSPAQQLEVKNGNLKADTIYFPAPNGPQQRAELKATYIDNIKTPGGYYAVLAP